MADKPKKSDLRKKREAIASEQMRQRAASGQMSSEEQTKILNSDDRGLMRRMWDSVFGRKNDPVTDSATFEAFAAKHDNDSVEQVESEEFEDDSPQAQQGEDEPQPIFTEGETTAPSIWEAADRGEPLKMPQRAKKRSRGKQPGERRSNAQITVEYGDMPDDFPQSMGSFSGGEQGGSGGEQMPSWAERLETKIDELPKAVEEELTNAE